MMKQFALPVRTGKDSENHLSALVNKMLHILEDQSCHKTTWVQHHHGKHSFAVRVWLFPNQAETVTTVC